MGKYFEKAVKSFLDDKGLEYEVEFREDCIFFKKLDANMTLAQLDEFMGEFRVIDGSTGGVVDGFAIDLELTYRDTL